MVNIDIPLLLLLPRLQKLHREVNAIQRAIFDRQITRPGSARAQQQGVELGAQRRRRNAHLSVVVFFPVADRHVGLKGDPLRRHEIDPALDDLFRQLHGGNAVGEEAADPVVPLEHRDAVAGLVQLIGGGEAGGAGAHHGDRFAGSLLGRAGLDPALVEGVVDDRALDILDGDGGRVDAWDPKNI